MTFDWTWIAVLTGLFVAWAFIRPSLGILYGPEIAARALAAQPDHIHLEPTPDEAWAGGESRDRLAGEITALGFREAGGFTVRELPGVRLKLFANGPEATYAVVYEHPQAGSWFDFACRFTDGSSFTWTTSRDTGLAQRPGHPVHHVPGAGVAKAWKCVARERPARPAQPASVVGAAADFENAWAENIAWRKQRGISRVEVARVATRPLRPRLRPTRSPV